MEKITKLNAELKNHVQVLNKNITKLDKKKKIGMNWIPLAKQATKDRNG